MGGSAGRQANIRTAFWDLKVLSNLQTTVSRLFTGISGLEGGQRPSCASLSKGMRRRTAGEVTHRPALFPSHCVASSSAHGLPLFVSMEEVRLTPSWHMEKLGQDSRPGSRLQTWNVLPIRAGRKPALFQGRRKEGGQRPAFLARGGTRSPHRIA